MDRFGTPHGIFEGARVKSVTVPVLVVLQTGGELRLARSLWLRNTQPRGLKMDSALPLTIAIGAAVACCVFLVGRYLTKPSETVAPLIPSPAAPVAAKLAILKDGHGLDHVEGLPIGRASEMLPNPAAREISHAVEKTGQPTQKMSWQRKTAYVGGAFVIVLMIIIGSNN
jgi:hypothetical protein